MIKVIEIGSHLHCGFCVALIYVRSPPD